MTTMMMPSIPQGTVGHSTDGGDVRRLDDPSATARFGTAPPLYALVTPEIAALWDDAGSSLVATAGSLRDWLAGHASLASSTGDRASFMPAPGPAEPAPSAPAAIGLPVDGMSPADWLLAAGVDLATLREWVFASGMGSRATTAWAAFATALGWEVPAAAAAEEEAGSNG